MLAPYDFFAPQRIVFGWGRRSEIGTLAKSLGSRAFVISGSRTLDANGTLDELCRSLTNSGVTVERLATQTREPEVADVDVATTRLRDIGLQAGDMLIAIGGGSAIDLAKAVSALATNTHGSGVQDFLEGVGRGLKIDCPPLPLLAMPTTAGTGTEATKNAVISSFDPPFKKSLRSDLMIPKIVLVDPELTVSLPRDITAHTGMDAITQLIESLISRRAKPIPRALCWQGLELALPAMFELSRNLNHRVAREAISHAALLSGIALANSGLGFAHGVAAALGVHAKIPHGLACAMMLPSALQLNREVAQTDLAQLGRQCCYWMRGEQRLPTFDVQDSDDAAVMHFQAVIHTLNERLGIPQRLSALGVTREQLPALAKGSRGNSMDGNPCDVSDDELLAMLERVW
ncbi:MAG: iron-containing alcohol dehydrogenase [Planctomycetaceae bacterium]|nr:iron-containing alcohol dehydrogenase [Planctomycetaceae bacterium]